ncbi:hypothetical protein V5097_03585 [Arenibacter palladensis]|uniref:hypothetical protein n=1 Tax=Arenibacter palladensis TaxID=237373 RepID=UPI002FD10C4C
MNEKKVNKSLFPKYWAGRVPIYLVMGLIPLLAGFVNLILYFHTNESYYKGYEYDLNTIEIESNISSSQFELEIKTNDKTINDRLDYDAWLNFLDNYGNPGIRKRVLNVENLKQALERVKNESPELKFYYNDVDKKITGLKINGHTIIFHYNHLLLGLLFTAIGVFLIGGSLYIIIKDPNKWYKEVKDPFSKYKS